MTARYHIAGKIVPLLRTVVDAEAVASSWALRPFSCYSLHSRSSDISCPQDLDLTFVEQLNFVYNTKKRCKAVNCFVCIGSDVIV